MKLLLRIVVVILVLTASVASAQTSPKREMRGAWLHTVFQDGYASRSTGQNKAFLCGQLDALARAGVNAVFFQVRPQADAFYPSELEPWSRFISPGGKAPVPAWDPLQFMIDEAHARGMELHAWLNPYRITSSKKQTLPAGHIARREPGRTVRFNGNLYFDPGLPENRDFIAAVVDDIISRYDVDGIHFDDYFYPYPVKGVSFDDAASYRKYGGKMKLADWRRHNVDLLIEKVHGVIEARKPWISFGVSPFGIWRNKVSDPAGSETSGLQNYDDLYADVLLWAERGWIDYQMPQLYWPLDQKSASSRRLIAWWDANARGRHMFIGQDVTRCMGADGSGSELAEKVMLTRRYPKVGGNCWWPGYEVAANRGGVADSLAATHQCVPALVPAYPWKSDHRPQAVDGLRMKGDKIVWKAPAPEGRCDDVRRFVVYRFEPGQKADISDPRAILGITYKNEWPLAGSGTYIVTALSRVNAESEPSTPLNIRL